MTSKHWSPASTFVSYSQSVLHTAIGVSSHTCLSLKTTDDLSGAQLSLSALIPTTLPLLHLLQPYWPPCCFWDAPIMLLPHGSSFWEEHSSLRYPHELLPAFLIFTVSGRLSLAIIMTNDNPCPCPLGSLFSFIRLPPVLECIPHKSSCVYFVHCSINIT